MHGLRDRDVNPVVLLWFNTAAGVRASAIRPVRKELPMLWPVVVQSIIVDIKALGLSTHGVGRQDISLTSYIHRVSTHAPLAG